MSIQIGSESSQSSWIRMWYPPFTQTLKLLTLSYHLRVINIFVLLQLKNTMKLSSKIVSFQPRVLPKRHLFPIIYCTTQPRLISNSIQIPPPHKHPSISIFDLTSLCPIFRCQNSMPQSIHTCQHAISMTICLLRINYLSYPPNPHPTYLYIRAYFVPINPMRLTYNLT